MRKGQRQQKKDAENMQEASHQGARLFRVHWILWKLLGIPSQENPSLLFQIYSIIWNVFFVICYPFHLFLGVLQCENQYDFFKNLTICLPVLTCSIKFYIFWWHLKKVRQIESILLKCEQAITNPDELQYYMRKTIVSGRRGLNLFYFICISASVTSEVVVIVLGVLTQNWQLMYPAYFPFDVKKSNLRYIIAHMYQWIGGVVMCCINFNNDTYTIVNLALLTGHVRMLGMRVSRIGKDSQWTNKENNRILIGCVRDFTRLLKYLDILQNIISFIALIQFVMSCLSICICIIFMIFYIDNMFAYTYYIVYMFGVMMEIYPICHYGSMLADEMANLTNFIFDCNWMDQNREFQKNLLIFAEQTLKPRDLKAGKMIGIDYQTFLATCKMAYSLFAVIMQDKL